MKNKEPDLILELENRIPAYYVSLNGQTKFYTLASMFLESAATHADLLGFGYHDMIRNNVYWVLSRFHIQMHAYPFMNHPVKVETWPKGVNKLFFMRDYRMYSESDQLMAAATTAWLILDRDTGRPKKMGTPGTLHDFYNVDRHGIETLPDRLPGVTEPDRQRSVLARYSDLDINNHVNAVKYIEWIQDCYDEEKYQSENVREFQINYMLETRFGEEVDIRIKNQNGADSFDYIEGLRSRDQNPAFRARICFSEFN